MDTKDAWATEQHTMNEADRKRFYTKRGELTVFALACGYVQLHTAKDGTQVRLDKPSPGGMQYDVRVWPPGYYDRNHPDRVWDAFDSLTEARKRYHQLVRKHP
jgi:hypothetical protein